MGRWLILTGGLLIWAVQFLGVYLISSIADVVATADGGLWRLIGGGFSLICLVGLLVLGGGVLAMTRRALGDDRERFELGVALGGVSSAGWGSCSRPCRCC